MDSMADGEKLPRGRAAVHFGQEAVKLGAGRGIIRPVHGKNPCPDRMCQGGIIRREIAVERDHGCDLRTGPDRARSSTAAPPKQ